MYEYWRLLPVCGIFLIINFLWILFFFVDIDIPTDIGDIQTYDEINIETDHKSNMNHTNDATNEIKQMLRNQTDQKSNMSDTNLVTDEIGNILQSEIDKLKQRNVMQFHELHSSSNIQSDITFVSVYFFDQNSQYKQSVNDSRHNMFEWMRAIERMFWFNQPIIMFGNAGLNTSKLNQTRYINNKKYNHSYAPFYFIQIEDSDLIFTNEINEYYNKTNQTCSQLPQSKSHICHFSLTACKAWANKWFFLYYVSNILNPFQSKYFAYIDAGFFRPFWSETKSAPFLYDHFNHHTHFNYKNRLSNLLEFAPYNETIIFSYASGLVYDFTCHRYAHRFDAMSDYYALGEDSFTGGNIFFGRTQQISTFTRKYYAFLKQGLKKSLKHRRGMCYDQGCFSSVVCNQPTLATYVRCNCTKYGWGPDDVFGLWRYVTGSWNNACNNQTTTVLYNYTVYNASLHM